MTSLLEKAFAEAPKLTIDQQNAIASLLLREMESERMWTDAFAQSQNEMAKLAAEAVAEFYQGKTE